ncbi:MAG: mechanosensitive ion channel family protein [Actinomycetota bacterium]|nr:mechanosensitive ion channel family protein [Actinomycetota bacterium]
MRDVTTVEKMVPFALRSWPSFAVAAIAALIVGIILVGVVALVVRGVSRRRQWQGDPVAQLRMPFRALVIVILVWIAFTITWPVASSMRSIDHGFQIVTIVAGGWFVAAILGALLSHAMGRYRVDVSDNRVARRVRTQLAIVRRLVYVVVAIVVLGAVLLTFPGVQAAGASVLASAGVVSVIAGLAAQSTLANVFAGIQLAFSDAIRVDDVVVVDTQWGRIEEITLSYVVVHIWDDRRLVLPSTYFTTTPFENWTRTSSELLGSVDFDLDWRVSPARMRDELDAMMAEAPLWDGRVKVLQVTDAVGGRVHVRVLVSAKDAPTLFDLRCFVRERMIDWLQRETPEALPVQRVQVEGAAAPVARPARKPARDADPGQPEGLFTGSPEAEERARGFTGSMPIVRPTDEQIAAGSTG